ncbi:MAG: NUDIX domain-containing protein, partial [Lachnospiraceae bacterium]|nr:NUDIX domain-containing protein [Lachnospiraceae bacterium]
LAGVLHGLEACGAFNQALMELGALVCVPNGDPHCAECPLADLCAAHAAGRETDFPVKAKAKPRRVEEKTVLVIRDGDRFALTKRPAKGLLAGMYEFPCAAGHLGEEEALKEAEALGFSPLRIRPLPEAKHIFSHVEWHMTGWVIRTAAVGTGGARRGAAEQAADGTLPDASLPGGTIFLVTREEAERDFPVPAAYTTYLREMQIRTGICE